MKERTNEIESGSNVLLFKGECDVKQMNAVVDELRRRIESFSARVRLICFQKKTVSYFIALWAFVLLHHVFIQQNLWIKEVEISVSTSNVLIGMTVRTEKHAIVPMSKQV